MQPMRCLFIAFFTLTLYFTGSVLAADYSGQVVSILDDDTLEVLHNQHPERIRLSGIDCPEKGQVYGNNAKQAASELVYGKEVTLQTHGHDKYGRTLADVLLPDGTNVNHALVKEGWCWWYPESFRPHRFTYFLTFQYRGAFQHLVGIVCIVPHRQTPSPFWWGRNPLARGKGYSGLCDDSQIAEG